MPARRLKREDSRCEFSHRVDISVSRARSALSRDRSALLPREKREIGRMPMRGGARGGEEGPARNLEREIIKRSERNSAIASCSSVVVRVINITRR